VAEQKKQKELQQDEQAKSLWGKGKGLTTRKRKKAFEYNSGLYFSSSSLHN